MEKREKKVTFSQFQKLGKVLMTPVMILPIAGILVGIGSAFTTKNIVALWPVLGNTYVKLFFNLLKAIVSANIKCTETPTESAVHFFFFIDQMRRR